MPSRKYCLISPCRDEAAYARVTLDSVTKQSIPPALWIIVDDGSRDETPRILAEYAAKFDYIKIIRREDRGFRKLGGGVIDAFYAGYDTIQPTDFDYICKLDLDLDIPSTYFECLMDRMEQNPRIGTCSGKPYFKKQDAPLLKAPDVNPGLRTQFPLDPDDGFISEKCGDENSVGMIKFYRRECFQQIGGFVRYLMWDGIDCHRCRMLGWIAVSWDDPELRFVHLRPMGTSHKNWWTGRVRHGVGQYYMGTSPVYMLASALFRMTRPPVFIGGLAMLWGYVKSMLSRSERYDEPEFRKFLRSYQWSCLRQGKRTATERLNRRQAEVWLGRNGAASDLVPAGASRR
jgi:biofilm PGA synthesis N-glycosyltransferase PgaC